MVCCALGDGEHDAGEKSGQETEEESALPVVSQQTLAPQEDPPGTEDSHYSHYYVHLRTPSLSLYNTRRTFNPLTVKPLRTCRMVGEPFS